MDRVVHHAHLQVLVLVSQKQTEVGEGSRSQACLVEPEKEALVDSQGQIEDSKDKGSDLGTEEGTDVCPQEVAGRNVDSRTVGDVADTAGLDAFGVAMKFVESCTVGRVGRTVGEVRA